MRVEMQNSGIAPFAEFVRTAAWRILPFRIKLALMHLRRTEEEPAIAPGAEDLDLEATGNER
jgi:hypothetical protein